MRLFKTGAPAPQPKPAEANINVNVNAQSPANEQTRVSEIPMTDDEENNKVK